MFLAIIRRQKFLALKPTNKKLAIKLLKAGKVGVIPTDTLYGLVGSAMRPLVVERIYKIKGRFYFKPFIVLIGDKLELLKFGIILSNQTEEIINKLWPGPVTIVLPSPLVNFRYLDRGKHTIAFRLPADEKLQKFLLATGPLVAPSANPAGKLPASNFKEAHEYFGDQVDFYLRGMELTGSPSTIVTIINGQLKVLRQGASMLELTKFNK